MRTCLREGLDVLTSEVVSINEFSGTPNEGWMRAKALEKGRPWSRANAHVMREDVVMMPTVAKTRQIRGNMRRHVAPGTIQSEDGFWRCATDRLSLASFALRCDKEYL